MDASAVTMPARVAQQLAPDCVQTRARSSRSKRGYVTTRVRSFWRWSVGAVARAAGHVRERREPSAQPEPPRASARPRCGLALGANPFRVLQNAVRRRASPRDRRIGGRHRLSRAAPSGYCARTRPRSSPGSTPSESTASVLALCADDRGVRRHALHARAGPAHCATRPQPGDPPRWVEPVSRAGRRLSGVLVVAQIALSIVVLIAGALLGRSGRRASWPSMRGLLPHGKHVLTMKLALGERTILRAGERRAFVQQLLDAVGRPAWRSIRRAWRRPPPRTVAGGNGHSNLRDADETKRGCWTRSRTRRLLRGLENARRRWTHARVERLRAGRRHLL